MPNTHAFMEFYVPYKTIHPCNKSSVSTRYGYLKEEKGSINKTEEYLNTRLPILLHTKYLRVFLESLILCGSKDFVYMYIKHLLL